MNKSHTPFTGGPISEAEADAATRRQVGRFRESNKAKALRYAFISLCKIAPNTAARFTFSLLARPPRSPERSWQTQLRESARLFRVRWGDRKIVAYSWGEGPAILMVHGWGARATHMGKMIEPLVKAGFRVISFDAPAHGASRRRSTDLVEYASAISAVAQHIGPIHTILAHSFGVAMALYARRDWGVEAQKQIYISSFNHCRWFTEAFRYHVGISAEVMERARQMMVNRYLGRFDWDKLSVVELLRRTHEPTLLVHDEDDGEIPFHHTLELYGAKAEAELFSTTGLGHHRLLGDPSVISRVVQFVMEQDLSSSLVASKFPMPTGERHTFSMSKIMVRV